MLYLLRWPGRPSFISGHSAMWRRRRSREAASVRWAREAQSEYLSRSWPSTPNRLKVHNLSSSMSCTQSWPAFPRLCLHLGELADAVGVAGAELLARQGSPSSLWCNLAVVYSGKVCCVIEQLLGSLSLSELWAAVKPAISSGTGLVPCAGERGGGGVNSTYFI